MSLSAVVVVVAGKGAESRVINFDSGLVRLQFHLSSTASRHRFLGVVSQSGDCVKYCLGILEVVACV